MPKQHHEIHANYPRLCIVITLRKPQPKEQCLPLSICADTKWIDCKISTTLYPLLLYKS